VRFPISENDYLRFSEKVRANPNEKLFANRPVQLKLSDGSIYPETGKFDLANRQIDPATGSMIIQAIFANSQRILRPGQYVRVRFETDEFKDATLVPQQAVNQLQNIYQVFLLGDSDKLKPKVVKVGNRVGSNWIISDGVVPGDKVAIIGSVSINPKLPVKPVMMPWNYDSTSKN
jgi:membrane fusion protein (multidrug efflux system)